jgi:FecR-like protein
MVRKHIANEHNETMLPTSRPHICRQVNEKRLFVMAVTSESAFFVIGVTSPVQQLR